MNCSCTLVNSPRGMIATISKQMMTEGKAMLQKILAVYTQTRDASRSRTTTRTTPRQLVTYLVQRVPTQARPCKENEMKIFLGYMKQGARFLNDRSVT